VLIIDEKVASTASRAEIAALPEMANDPEFQQAESDL
jgi:hypothetical protein